MFFISSHNFNIYSNPFSMGCMAMNPRVNFFLGLAGATAMPGFCNPFAGSIFNTPYMSSMYMPFANPFGYLNNFSFTGGVGAVNPFGFMNFMPSVSSSVSSSVSYESEPQGVNLKKNKDEYGPEFLNKVKEIAKRLNCNYRDLLGVMNSESGINAKAKNPNSSATGLIQFMESTAKSLGTSTSALAAMSPVEQLDYVEKYLQRAKKTAGFAQNDKLSGGQLYALVFLPARANREVLTSSGENYYGANRGLDTNKDGNITKAELDNRIKNKYVSDNTFLA